MLKLIAIVIVIICYYIKIEYFYCVITGSTCNSKLVKINTIDSSFIMNIKRMRTMWPSYK